MRIMTRDEVESPNVETLLKVLSTLKNAGFVETITELKKIENTNGFFLINNPTGNISEYMFFGVTGSIIVIKNEEDCAYHILPIVDIEEIKKYIKDLEIKKEKAIIKKNSSPEPVKDNRENLDKKINETKEEIEYLYFEYGEAPELVYNHSWKRNDLIKRFKGAKIIPTNQKYTFLIDENGKESQTKIYQDIETGKKYLLLIEKNGDLVDVSNLDWLENERHIMMLEFKPIKWVLDASGKSAVPANLPLFGNFKGKYKDSYLEKFLESERFLKQIGLLDSKELEMDTSNDPVRKIFKKGKIENLNLADKIRRSLVGGKRVPYLVGHPGIGKTQIVKSLGKNVLHFNVSTFTPDAFTGKTGILQGDTHIIKGLRKVEETREEGKTFVAKPAWYIKLIKMSEEAERNHERCILFLDEFDKLTPNMQVFINGIVDDPRTIAGWEIPANVDIILAGNTEEYSEASMPISGEVVSRLNRIEVVPSVIEWLEWAVNNGVDPIVVTYISLNRDKLLCDAKTATGEYDYSKSLNPRSWDQKISEAIKAGRYFEEMPDLEDIMTKEERENFEKHIALYGTLDVDLLIKGDYSTISNLLNNLMILKVIFGCVIPYLKDEEKLTKFLRELYKNNVPKEIIQSFKLEWLEIHPGSENTQMLRLADEDAMQSQVKKNG